MNADNRQPDDGLRGTVRLVALLNLAYFGIEFVAARIIGSVSLFADSIDFLEDASVNLLILMGAALVTSRASPRRHGACAYPACARAGNALDDSAET